MNEVRKKIHYIQNSTGTNLALHLFSKDEIDTVRCPVAVLSHGTFSNHRSCRGLAEFLAGQGWQCWVIDSQGHGNSDIPRIEPSFETLYLEDTEAVFRYLCEQRADLRLSWIGHSGGGLAIMMYLARNPHRHANVCSISLLASQATDAGNALINRVKIRMSSIIIRWLGYAPGKPFRLGPENEFAAVMQQWFRWSLSGRWIGQDGFDYLKALSKIHIPCLSLAAAADPFIAPPSGCLKLHQAISSNSKKFMVCGLAENHREDYNHARIISSRNASKDIWPLVLKWLEKHG